MDSSEDSSDGELDVFISAALKKMKEKLGETSRNLQHRNDMNDVHSINLKLGDTGSQDEYDKSTPAESDISSEDEDQIDLTDHFIIDKTPKAVNPEFHTNCLTEGPSNVGPKNKLDKSSDGESKSDLEPSLLTERKDTYEPFESIPQASVSKTKNKQNKLKDKKWELASSLKTSINVKDIYLNVDPYKKPKSSLPRGDQQLLGADRDKEVMKRSVITPDFEKRDVIPPYEESLRQQKKQRKKERLKTKGKGWFDLPAPEMTEEKKNDLTLLQMRQSLNPKQFYKGNDIRALPKYFQFGKVVESAADFYHSRIPKKQRKATMVEELLADAEFRKYNKRKYSEIQDAKRRGMGPYKQMKRMKKKKKLH